MAHQILPSVLTLLLFTALCPHVHAQDLQAGTHTQSLSSNTVPETIAYQGYLTDNANQPINGSANLEFSLYPALSGGTAVWTEVHLGVSMADGVYNVQLGSLSSLDGVDFNAALWLGLRVNGGAELTPRTALASVPYALGLRLPFSGSAEVNAGGAVVEVENTGSGAGVQVLGSGSDGVRVVSAGAPSSSASNSGENGFEVQGAEGVGLFVGHSDDAGVYVYSAGGIGYYVYSAGGDGVRVDNAVGYSLNIKGRKNASATPNGHVAIIENNSFETVSGPDVLALKTSATIPGSSVNFITFFDGDNTPLGRIEGNGSGGVSYGSGGADYAEYLPHLTPGTSFEPGDLIGVFAGHITHQTQGADQVMAITDRAAVLGNTPPGEDTEGFEAVSFVGQVAVKVAGPVEAGDYIVASGRSDGAGRAVSASEITLSDLEGLVGRAWAASAEPGVKRVNVVVGLDRSEVMAYIVTRQAERLDRQDALLRQQADELSMLRAQMEALLRREPAGL